MNGYCSCREKFLAINQGLVVSNQRLVVLIIRNVQSFQMRSLLLGFKIAWLAVCS